MTAWSPRYSEDTPVAKRDERVDHSHVRSSGWASAGHYTTAGFRHSRLTRPVRLLAADLALVGDDIGAIHVSQVRESSWPCPPRGSMPGGAPGRTPLGRPTRYWRKARST